MLSKGQSHDHAGTSLKITISDNGDFVLEKSIFSNIFDRDIKRVFIYKKAERLAKAIHLITPAFHNAPSLRDRIDTIAIGLVDAAILSPAAARDALSRELLALSSVLSIARTSSMLSAMNSELISREAHLLLQEVAAYEEPRLFLDDVPSLSELSKAAPSAQMLRTSSKTSGASEQRVSKAPAAVHKGHTHIKDNDAKNSRRDAIVSIIRTKGSAYIKDISTVIRNVSEKTIQRELAALVLEGVLTKQGERRWTSYTITSSI
ncbi:MAG: hypothetical protein B7X04_00290 [Parcubacteria group bacterium 21-54-25]|nr:MAG: hypothetical protein B7X04_00290 [Parcubacteria group bacterium 21-54-25]HQU07503.1 hypothetical protein [Candidatus Paceibacterota bacterium]